MIMIVFLLLYKHPMGVKKIAVLASVLFAMYLPQIHNYQSFGFFGASSWIGLNLSQVAPERGPGCTFYEYRETVSHIGHDGTAFNDPQIIGYAQDCLATARRSILSNPAGYAAGRLNKFLLSTRKTASDYFYIPNGFENYPRISGLHFNKGGNFNPKSLLSLFVFLFNISMFLMIFLSVFFVTSKYRSICLVACIYMAVLVGIGHAVNGEEQERFRYSMNVIMYLTLVLWIRHLAMKRLALQPARMA